MWVISLARNAIVVMIGILIAYVLFDHDIQPFQITGNITEGLPPFSLPPFTIVHGNRTYSFVDLISELGSSLLSIPLIAILESVAIAKAFGKWIFVRKLYFSILLIFYSLFNSRDQGIKDEAASRANTFDVIFLSAKGKTLDANQEMLALGLCNVFGSFARSMPTTGSFTRTAVNNASGVKTPMGGVITGSLVLLTCGLLTSTFKFIPKATLAAVIMIAMFYMLEVRVFVVLWRTKSKTDIYIYDIKNDYLQLKDIA